jgi:hypothetical protein
VGQKLLEAVFGDQAVQDLTARARTALEQRVNALLGEEEARYTGVLDVLAVDPEAPDRLRQAARGVDDVRYATHRALD